MSEESNKRRSLGRGLSALFGDEAAETPELRRSIRNIPIEQIKPSKYQPRRHFDAQTLDELTQSIRDKGILQPLLVRVHATVPNAYELIAGERRWRAAQQVPLHEVPVIIRDFSDRETLEIALIENLQRADLNPIEEATAYVRLMEEFSHTQADLARSLGKSRSHIANVMRLLALPERVRDFVSEGKLSAGHARALIGLDEAEALADTIIDRGMTVRQVEAMAQRQRGAEAKRDAGEIEPPRPARAAEHGRDPNTIALERELSERLGYRVTISETSKGVDLTLHCDGLDQLDELLKLLR